jgi:Uroporphyrinogen decarboxylase (URO-D)
MKLDTDTMSQEERLRTVLNFEEPDRLPCFLLGMPVYSDFYQEFIRREDELMDPYTEDETKVLLTPSGDYTTETFFGADIITNGAKQQYQNRWIDDDGKVQDQGVMVNGVETGKFVDRAGRLYHVEILPNGFPYNWYKGGFLNTVDEINNWFDTYGWPHERKVTDMTNDFVSTNKQFSDSLHMIGGFGPGLFEFSWFMMGQSRFAYHCRKNPDLIHKIVKSIKESQIKQVESFKHVKPTAIFRCDDMGQKGRSILSEKMHIKFFSEARKEVNDAIHDLGAKSILHSCGNITDLLPELIKCGTDGWQTIEPASAIDNDLIKKKFGKKITFWGAIDNNVLCFGNKQEVEQAVKKTVSQLAPGGGYVIGPSHDYLNTKVDCAIALRDSIAKFGRYPIS